MDTITASQAVQIEAHSNGLSSVEQWLSDIANLLPWWVWVAIPIVCLLYAIYLAMKPIDEKVER